MTCSWSINQSHTNTNMNSLSHTHKQACTHAWNWVCVYVCVYVLYLVQIPYTTYTTQLRNNVCTVYIHECVCVCVSGPSLLAADAGKSVLGWAAWLNPAGNRSLALAVITLWFTKQGSGRELNSHSCQSQAVTTATPQSVSQMEITLSFQDDIILE